MQNRWGTRGHLVGARRETSYTTAIYYNTAVRGPARVKSRTPSVKSTRNHREITRSPKSTSAAASAHVRSREIPPGRPGRAAGLKEEECSTASGWVFMAYR